MTIPKCSDGDFIRLFEKFGPEETAKKLGSHIRKVYERRENLEKKTRRQITAPASSPNRTRFGIEHPHRVTATVENGIVLVGSDGHYWPGPATTAHRAFVKFCKDLRPSLVVMNGDALDASTISRHPPIGWEHRPTLVDEIEACKERLHEIVMAKPPQTRCIWPAGNHDQRFATRLATVAPEYAKIHGYQLKDHFSDAWEPCWSCWVNDEVVIKHRYRSGRHAAANNAQMAGKTIVTGHTHQLQVTAVPDYRGTRWGVETGSLADSYGEQFRDYTEDNPRLWQSGFAVLTFDGGKLLQPELVRVHDDEHVDWRGKLHRV